MDELAPATKMLAETRSRPLRLFVTDVTQVRLVRRLVLGPSLLDGPTAAVARRS